MSINASGAELIAAERQRQVESEGWTLEHDDAHYKEEMALAAIVYAYPKPTPIQIKRLWPWDWSWYKPVYTPTGDPFPLSRTEHQEKLDRIRELTKAGALIAAEIDRLQRQA